MWTKLINGELYASCTFLPVWDRACVLIEQQIIPLENQSRKLQVNKPKNPQMQHFPWRRATSTNARRTWRVCKKSLFAKTAVKQNLCLSPKTDSKQQTSQTQEAAPCWMLRSAKGRAAITCNARTLGVLLAACLCPLKRPVGGKGRLPLLHWKADLHPLTRDGSAGLEKTAKRESLDWKNRVQIIWRSCTSSQIKCWHSLQREC